MKFKNPVLRGMYPDPSMCVANGKYYMVCSTFQYFPGVPLFESEDLINWKQIGHVLTRKSQLLTEKNNTGAGIYAPTIRYDNGRFYMVVTNVSNIGNFYVYTDDIYGEWSDPIIVEQNGIDPSLFFDDDGKVYFISNGNDSEGRGFIQMSQIDIETGKKITENEPLWYGTGGRYIEAPHMYKFGEYYYLLNAEGGTEYGHMVNYARSKNIRGPFEPCPLNPVLTNRNLGGYQLQGAGHGDIVQAADGTWWFCHLAFRQIDRYMPFHHLGRETCIEPVVWKDGWFYIGTPVQKECVCGAQVANGYNQKQGYGNALLEVECPSEHKFAPQNFSYTKTFASLALDKDWCYLCNPTPQNYSFKKDSFELTACDLTIDTPEGSPTFIGVRQCEFEEKTECTVELFAEGENGTAVSGTDSFAQGGISVYMDPNHHYDVYVCCKDGKFYAECKITIGQARQVLKSIPLESARATFVIESGPYNYSFYIKKSASATGSASSETAASSTEQKVLLGQSDTRYLSSEVACGFTGVFTGLYVQKSVATAGTRDIGATGTNVAANVKAKFTNLSISHKEE
ncbi:MAG: glycoside hydrolase family 43 protein [Treponema sp.]|nr:glycoside hydrolase family 43 protein [Treponema sp.]